MRFVVVLLFGLGCVSADAVVCGDGRTCPGGTTCDDVRAVCVTAAQGSACNGIDDGKPCDAAGAPGICDRGLCLPGCGDSVTDPDEQCDDGNFASHDGCSSRCVVEVPTWLPIEPHWGGVVRHAAAYHAALDRIVVVGGVGPAGERSDVWQLGPVTAAVSGGWREIGDALGTSRPSLRSGAAYAYDPTRQVLVVYGGLSPTGQYLDDTWEYAASGMSVDGEPIGVWTQIVTPGPSPRTAAALAFDENLGKLVLFGGLTRTGTFFNDETWTYDGTWTQLSPTTIPNTRARATMAFLPERDRLVLYGGGGGGGTATWEFDGVDWTGTALTPNPAGRSGAVMAYDASRGALVLFGGLVSGGVVASDTWTYDGVWTRLGTTVSPPARREAVLVADPRRESLVLIGGAVSDAAVLDDVWELGAPTAPPLLRGWSDATPRFAPSATFSSAAAFSSSDGTLLAVGGGVTSLLDVLSGFEVWAFDGRRWSQQADLPVDRFGHALVFDTANDRYLMIGGACNSTPDGCDAMSLSTSVYARPRTGSTWAAVAPLPDGAQRQNHAAVYDEAHHRVVVVGGIDGVGAPLAGTFVFDGTAWSSLAGVPGPAPGTSLATWDPVREAVVAFDVNGATWELRGDQWDALLPSGSGPSGRVYGAMTYDPGRKRHLLAGGTDSAGLASADVWELDTALPAWAPVFVAGQTPLPRTEHVLMAHPNARGAVLVSGASGSGVTRSDSWMLRYVSATPDEICDDDMDTDGDGQQDLEDPDCSPPPP